MKKTDEIKVGLKVHTMRQAGKWIEILFEVDKDFRAAMPDEFRRFLLSLSKRTAEKVTVSRRLAESLSNSLIDIFQREAPELLTEMDHPSRGSQDGARAMASIAIALRAALLKGKGRPKLNPIQCWIENERFKRERQRSSSGVAGGSFAYEQAMQTMGITSKGAFSSAVKRGKSTVLKIDGMKRCLPAGSEILFALTDQAGDNETVVMCVKVPGKANSDINRGK